MTTPRASFPSPPSMPSLSAHEPSTTAAPALPPPDTFDVVPQLHSLLARLLQTNVNGLGLGGTSPPPAGQDAHVPSYLRTEPLDIQQLAAAATDLKLRIRKMRVEVGKLPDVDRRVEEQEEEMRGLRERVEKLRGVLVGLGGREKGVEEGDGSEMKVDVKTEE